MDILLIPFLFTRVEFRRVAGVCSSLFRAGLARHLVDVYIHRFVAGFEHLPTLRKYAHRHQHRTRQQYNQCDRRYSFHHFHFIHPFGTWGRFRVPFSLRLSPTIGVHYRGLTPFSLVSPYYRGLTPFSFDSFFLS